jgi:ribulose-5-phosphate 4-epimerase/fuculose-1-phosphate aldolase
MSSETAVITSALKSWRFLYRRGFIEGFGHLSVRVPGTDRFLLTRHQLGLKADADDFLLVDMDGKKLSGRGELPGEYPIHLEILRARPDVSSVIHYHGMHSTAFTTSGVALKPIHMVGTLFHDGIPVYADPRLVNNRQRGEALVKALGPHRVALLYAHGVAVTGASVEESVASAFLFEENARRASISAGINQPVWMDDDLAAACGGELLQSRGPLKRVWAMVEAEDEEQEKR